MESWLEADVPGFSTTNRWQVGRPLLNENDYGLRLYDGDTGVIIRSVGGPPRQGGL